MLLDGIRVLDFTRLVSGPWATMLLADLGAEVIKVEEPRTGDEMRQVGPPFIEGEGGVFLQVNRNKKSVAVDLRKEEGQELVHRFISLVDVVLHNFRPGFAQACGLEYDTLKRIKPSLIYCWISGFGESGPYANYLGNDLVAMAFSGAMSVAGQRDGPPVKSMASFSDIITGYNAVAAILASLRHRDRTGRGQRISVNLLDSIVAVLAEPWGYYFGTGEPPMRMAPDTQPQIAPAGTFRTGSGDLAIAVHAERQWAALCQGLGAPHLAKDPRFERQEQRIANRDEMRTILEEALAHKTNREWTEVLQAVGVPVAPVQTLDEVARDPQIIHNEMIATVGHPQCGPIQLLRSPLGLAEGDLRPMTPPPLLGQHTEEVLTGVLGLSSEEVVRLRDSGVIACKQPAPSV